ncbi:MAG: sigma-70 family RNA polymerase sigma factor [Sediminibacterium magnilacihabitans]|jgi:RNA polymerase sigma factor (sigma-70 family)|nr:sigma-70 family RNA polymerase sigma factor [Sediminibacterium magnilacihabitans]PQV62136.1 RNA polymerase sigma factor (sigma-70 family) [Sediminibacterium magnilacihabitans]
MRQEQNDSNNNYALLFQSGDEKALSFFYHEFYPALVYYSFQIVQNRPIAEDVASEAFVKTWRMHYKLDSYAGIKAYLYKIVHRDSIEAISKEQKRAQSYKNLLPPVNTDSPFDNMVRSEVYRIIHTALKDLSPACRRVVIMHYFEGKTTGQIARELNLHASTIKSQKMQGLKTLRKIFTKPLLWVFYICIKFFIVFL